MYLQDIHKNRKTFGIMFHGIIILHHLPKYISLFHVRFGFLTLSNVIRKCIYTYFLLYKNYIFDLYYK